MSYMPKFTLTKVKNGYTLLHDDGGITGGGVTVYERLEDALAVIVKEFLDADAALYRAMPACGMDIPLRLGDVALKWREP